MKRFLITGARGYIGSALAHRLSSEGHAVRLVSRSPAGWHLPVREGVTIEYFQADLGVEESWLNLLEGTDAVVHLSARTDLRAAEADPAGDHVLNVAPVRALVRAVERHRAPTLVVFASSTSIAGDKHVNPVNEETLDRPCSIYDRHKLECEMMLAEATKRGVLRACTLRLPTVYGYGIGIASSNPNRGVLNTMIRRAASGEALTVYGEGKYIRDYIFIQDVVDAFWRALDSEYVQKGRHFVVATGCGYTLAESFKCVAREAYRATGRVIEVRHVPEPPNLHPIERSDFIGDASLFRRLTGWHPQTDLKSGIRDYFDRLIVDKQAAVVATG
jgi:nucleoside-diphosphate-sugar epimerase